MWFIDPPECLLCLLESRYSELKALNVRDPKVYVELGKYVMDNAARGRVTVSIESHVWIRRRLSVNDPHGDEKGALEGFVKGVIDDVVSKLGSDVIAYVELSASANSVDIPMRGYNFDKGSFLARLGDRASWLGITPEDLRWRIDEARSVGYVVDNAGEFQIDKLLIRRLAEAGKEVVVYARSEPYEVDVTEDYVKRELSGLGVKVVGSGSTYTALANRDLWGYLGSHDLLLIKGLDNFETYLELKPPIGNAVFMLRAKCPLIARLLGVPRESPVIVISDYLRGLRV